MNGERLAAALEFDRKRRAQNYLMSEPGTQPLTQGEDVLGFLRGVGGNLAGRAESVYNLATTPSRWIPEAQNVVTGLVELGKAAISDPAGTGRAIAQGEVQRASQAAGSPKKMGEYAANFIDPLRLAKALRYRGPIAELDVYHGTPHRFPATEANPLGEFDASKIGTGEGAQAYGHGIYFAESPSVAKAYQNPNAGSMFLGSRGINVSGKTYSSSGQLRKARDEATDMTEKAMYDILATAQSKGIDGPSKIAKAIKDNPVAWGSWEFGQDTLNAAMKRIRKEASFSSQKGSFYKADLPDEMIDRMLDWDKPLSEQSAAVRNAFNDLLDETGNYQSSGIGGIGNLSGSDAADLYNDLKGMWNENYGPDDLVNIDAPSASAAVSEFLRRRGILGIKYLDAGSRGQGGSGTRNFVVFPGEEKKVRILERK